MNRRTSFTRKILFVLAIAASPAGAQSIDDLEEIRFAIPKDAGGKPRGRASLVPGKEGKAVRFEFDDKCQNAFFTKTVRPDARWDEAAGFSFWVRGDGSDRLGGIELIHPDDFARRYAVAFSLRDKTWRKVTVAWRDLVPETAAAPFLDGKEAKPSSFGNFWVGKWWYWGEYGPHSFEMDEITLEQKIEIPATQRPEVPPLARLAAKLKEGKPITVVTMGDSLTDTRHWANRQTNWPAILKERLTAEFGSKAEMVNVALGGTELKPNLVLLPRWAETTKPDLVTMLFGYNDWSSGMRGPHFRESLVFAVDRIRRETGAEVLLMTTVPAIERWETMAELALAAREAAKETGAGLADTEKAFLAVGADPAARAKLFCEDGSHLGAEGHRLVAATVLDAIRAGGGLSNRP